METRNVETITHTTFSLKPFILYIITKTVRFLISSSRQVSREIHPQVIKISQPKFQTVLRVGIQAKRFSSINFHCFPISVDKNHLIAMTIFIDFDFYLLTTPGPPGCTCNYTWIYTNVILKGWQIQILKNWEPTDLANISHQKKIFILISRKHKMF